MKNDAEELEISSLILFTWLKSKYRKVNPEKSHLFFYLETIKVKLILMEMDVESEDNQIRLMLLLESLVI